MLQLILNVVASSLLFQSLKGLSCPFQNYSSSILDSQNPFSNTTQFINYESGNWYATGFWSKYVAYKTMNQTHIIDQPFEGPEIGQLMLSQKQIGNKNKKEYNISVYFNFEFYWFQMSYFPTHFIDISYFDSGYYGHEVRNLVLRNQEYEGIWQLTLIEYCPNDKKIIFKSGGQIIEIQNIKLQSGQIFYIIGGYGKDSFNQNSYKPFNGYFSQIMTFSQYLESNLLTWVQGQCQVPKQSIITNVTTLIQNIQTLYGDKYIYKQVKLIDQHFVSRGWIKLDLSKIYTYSDMLLLRLTINNKYLQGNGQNGDKTLFITYQINILIPSQSSITIQTYHYLYPFKSSYYSQYLNSDKYSIRQNNLNELLQNWHYFTFEHGRISDTEHTQFKLWFDINQSPIIKNFDFLDGRNIFSNTIIYCYIGGDKFSQTPFFQGQISMLQFITGLSNDFDINEYPVCHYSCSTCFGPDSNNCITCSQNAYRKYLVETDECKCEQGYIDIGGEEQCSNQLNVFPLMSINSIKITSKQFNCDLGYFLSFNNGEQICQPCPQYQSKNYYCFDCYQNPLNWYKYPQCSKDFIQEESITQGVYKVVQRDAQNFDIYTLNQQNELILHSGVQGFTNRLPNLFNNYIIFYHQDQVVYLQCKTNFVLIQNLCIQCSENCLKCIIWRKQSFLSYFIQLF